MKAIINSFYSLNMNYKTFKQSIKVTHLNGKIEKFICKLEDRNMKYRKKPVTVDAILAKIGYKNLSEIIAFVGQENICPIERRMDYQLKIKTAEGVMTAHPGYWIIKAPDPKGGYRCWPVDPDYFAENYEKVEE